MREKTLPVLGACLLTVVAVAATLNPTVGGLMPARAHSAARATVASSVATAGPLAPATGWTRRALPEG